MVGKELKGNVLLCDEQASNGDLESRFNKIGAPIKKIFEILIDKTGPQHLPGSLLEFLAMIANNKCFPPQDFLFEFEVSRLNFNTFGTYKDMTPMKSKMIIGCFVYIRVLLAQIILHLWDIIPSLSKDEKMKKNIRGLATLMYHIFADFLRNNLAFQQNNQKHLPTEIVIRPRKESIRAFEGEPEERPEPKKECEMIKGLLSKNSMTWLYTKKKPWVDNLKALVECWLDKFYELINEFHSERLKKMNHLPNAVLLPTNMQAIAKFE
eukprot:TRINITY_DN12553_c0_g1_i1.p1 TRINITY_DN12553_c0_g1~~TRINITY_DN12553_c0_g1_i1.p1  ORF type:complete len:266 (-),score=49.33 TRINITY_DN12553_c0_g1_i1:2-799(-)